MDRKYIENAVAEKVEFFTKMQRTRGRVLSFSPLALKLLADMVENIEKDPSPFWSKTDNFNEFQEHSINDIPNFLQDILRRLPLRRAHYVTSWELLHNIQRPLIKWCPVPKDI